MPSTHVYYQNPNVSKEEDSLEEEYVSFFTSEQNNPRDNLPATCDRRLQISCIVDPNPIVLCGGGLYANNHLTFIYMTKQYAEHLNSNRNEWAGRHGEKTSLTEPYSDGAGDEVEGLKAYRQSLSEFTEGLGLTYPAQKALTDYLCGYPTRSTKSGISRIQIGLDKVPWPQNIPFWEATFEIFNFAMT